VNPRARLVALALGGLGIAAGLALGLPALVTHAEARAAWAAERADQGSDGYDARRSDRFYAESRDAWRRAGLAGQLLGGGLLLFTLGAVRPREPGAQSASRSRASSAAALDAVVGAGVLAAAWVDAGESAALNLARAAAPWLAALPFAPLPAGTSLGSRLLGVGVPPSPRGILAVVVWPLAFVGGLHLRLAGLPVRRSPAADGD